MSRSARHVGWYGWSSVGQDSSFHFLQALLLFAQLHLLLVASCPPSVGVYFWTRPPSPSLQIFTTSLFMLYRRTLIFYYLYCFLLVCSHSLQSVSFVIRHFIYYFCLLNVLKVLKFVPLTCIFQLFLSIFSLLIDFHYLWTFWTWSLGGPFSP